MDATVPTPSDGANARPLGREPQPTDSAALTVAEALDVLRYWSTAVRHEEGLASRLRVEPGRSDGTIDVLHPGEGARYAKLPGARSAADPTVADAVARALARGATVLDLPMSGDLPALFEGWLRARYRAEALRALGVPHDGAEDGWLIGFPVIHDASRNELDVLLRIPVQRLAWRRADGGAWAPPPYSARRAGKSEPPPTRLQVQLEPVEAGVLPYAVSEPVLSRALGVNEDDLTAFVAGLEDPAARSAEAVLAALLGLLGAEPEAEPGLEAVVTAMNRRLGGPLRAWPVAILFDGARQSPMGGLLAELRTIAGEPAHLADGTALGCYVRGERPASRRDVVRSLPWAEPLTEGQREAAARAGSTLSACQGPPGTGKTRLVVALLADAVVESAVSILKSRVVLPDPFVAVVTSTNNRAVDTALDPLSVGEGRLPVALRVGNQEVTASATVARIGEALDWLRHAPPGPTLLAAKADFASALAAVKEQLAPLRRTFDARAAADRSRARLAEAERARERAAARVTALGAEPPDAEAARVALAAVGEASLELDVLLDALDQGRARKVRRWWGRLHATLLPAALEALKAVGRPIVAPAVPEDPKELAAWRERSGDELADVLEDARLELEALVGPAMDRSSAERALGRAEAELELAREAEEASGGASLEENPPDEAGIYDATVEARAELYRAACGLREAWAQTNRVALEPILTRIHEELRDRPFLGRALEDGSTRRALLALFPAMGCTLLSLRSSIPLVPRSIDRLIVDEAGQCHPAYVVPALARARSAVIVGDTHQLEPVVLLDGDEEARALRRAGLKLAPERLARFRVTARRPVSAQHLVELATGEVTTLRDHFRCREPIIAISDRLCGYDLRVRTPARTLGGWAPWLEAPVIMMPVAGEQVADAGSWRNDAEVEATLAALSSLLAGGVAPESVAVLTPYRAQLAALRRGVRRTIGGRGGFDAWSESATEGGVALGTVHRFQGGERDIVLLSTVVSRERSLSFLNERVNLVNVAVSRARLHLVVIGDPETLVRGRITRELVHAATPVRTPGW